MKKIFKFSVGTSMDLVLPKGAEIVHFGQDPRGNLCLWAKLDPSVETEIRSFAILGTGHDIPDGWTYVASAVNGDFVWHLHELPR